MSFCVYLLEDCNGFGYIGSTCNLKRRLINHRSSYNRCESKILAKPYTHLVLEEYEDKDNLEFAEQFYIKLYKSLYGDKLLNKLIPLRTDKEYRIDNKDKIREKSKEYKIDNKDKIREKMKEYYTEKKDKITEKHKEYRLVNKDKMKQYRVDNKDKIKQYRVDNKDKIREKHKEYVINNKEKVLEIKKKWRSQIIECECGSTIQLQEKARHLKSQKHINFTNNKN
jgi:predicted GIY-YIG superfamily endonuclease